MSDLAIDPTTDDLFFEDGDFAVVTGDVEIVQRARSGLQLVQGEWFFNRGVGVPYYSRVFGKTRPDSTTLNAIFTQAILLIDGINSLVEPIDYTLNKNNRIISLSFKAKTDSGIIEQTVGVIGA